jgi:hypothetical protein
MATRGMGAALRGEEWLLEEWVLLTKKNKCH